MGRDGSRSFSALAVPAMKDLFPPDSLSLSPFSWSSPYKPVVILQTVVPGQLLVLGQVTY